MAHEIRSCADIRIAEKVACEHGETMHTLMRRAGEACADILHARKRQGRVVVLAGPGNNGGDAFVAARKLVELGREVVLHELPDGARTEEGAAAVTGFSGKRKSLGSLKVEPADIVLDGLFGAGLSRELTGDAAEAVEQVNASRAFVVAIDVPSGVNGDQQQVSGPAINADLTVTFGVKKLAHVLQPAADLCGEVVVVEIGFGIHTPHAETILRENAPDLWAHAMRWPTASSHKHARGRLAVVSGGAANTGAARLAAQAGLRSGAGAVTLMTPHEALPIVAGSVMAVMTTPFAGSDALVKATERSSCVVIGPAAGVSQETRAHVSALAQAGRKLVLDADALSVFAGEAHALGLMLTADAVLTPHAGEFERLFPGLLASSNKVDAARAAAVISNAAVLLKGFDTVVAAPDGKAVVNTHASPFLATAGSGDVLAGLIGGLMAQGLDAFDAACAGAWLHGDAGVRAGAGLTAEDLDVALKDALAALYARR